MITATIILHILVIGWLILPFLLTLCTKRPSVTTLTPSERLNSSTDFACLITAYRRTDIALPLIQSLLKQTHSNLTVYVVADQCTDTYLLDALITDPRLQLLLPPEPLQSKVKSMQYALQYLTANHTHIVVFDPDNLATPCFLSQLDTYLQRGYRIVQGKRIAKNLDTPYACADALGEVYKNYIERYVPFALGSSASIAGSGMAVETELFSAFLASPPITQRQSTGQVIAAEDKMLQNFLVRRREIIAFAHDALLYDEKVQSGEQVTRQRTRWLFAYFENLQHALRHIGAGILTFDRNRFLFGYLAVIPPLFILLSVALLLYGIDITMAWTSNAHLTAVIAGIAPWKMAFWWWAAAAMIGAIGVFTINILWILYLDRAPRAIWQSLGHLPLFIGRQLLGLLQINKAKRDFLTTQHTKIISLEEAEQQTQSQS